MKEEQGSWGSGETVHWARRPVLEAGQGAEETRPL
jgi:hypothetical protein